MLLVKMVIFQVGMKGIFMAEQQSPKEDTRQRDHRYEFAEELSDGRIRDEAINRQMKRQRKKGCGGL